MGAGQQVEPRASSASAFSVNGENLHLKMPDSTPHPSAPARLRSPQIPPTALASLRHLQAPIPGAQRLTLKNLNSAVRVGSQASHEEHTKKKEAGGKTGQKKKRACLMFTHFSHQCPHGNNSLHYPRKSPYPRDRDATTP